MAQVPLNILLIEDSPGDRRLVCAYMSDIEGRHPQIHCVERLDEGLARLKQGPIDTVILDLSLPDSTGLQTFRKLHSEAPNMPIIVLTGTQDETLGLEAVRIGAEDYLVKNQIDGRQLIRSILFAMERASRRKLEQRLTMLAASERRAGSA